MKKLLPEWILLFLLLLPCLVVGQTPVRKGLFFTDADVLQWRSRFESGPYLNKGDVSANSPGDGARINTNASNFRNNPANGRYTNYFTGSGYHPRGGSFDPGNAGVNLRDCAFRSLLYRGHPNTTKAALSTADATAVIAELKRIVNQPISTTNTARAFDWTNTVRWSRIKPTNFQDLNPGFTIAEWLTRYLFAAECVKAVMSGGDSTTVYAFISQGAYYMLHNFEEDANFIFANRPAGDYHARPGFDYNREIDASDVKIMYSTASAVGPLAHYLTRHYSNRRMAMAYFVGAAGIALNDPYLIGIGKRWFKECIRFSIHPAGDYVDMLRGTKDKNVNRGIGYSHLSGLYAFADMLALTGDFSLYQFEETRGPEVTSLPITGINRWGDNTTTKTVEKQILRLSAIRNRQVSLYASPTAGVNPARLITGGSTLIDGLFALANRYYRNNTIKQTYLRTATGAVPYPANPAPSGPSVAAAVLAQYPGLFLMFAGLENSNDRYRQAVVDPGHDTTIVVIPPTPPPPPIVAHWANFNDTITITAPTQFLNYDASKALLHGDTVGIASRYVTAHSGADTLTYLFASARGLDSVSVATGRDRFDPEASYRVEYKHSGTWSSLLDVTGNAATHNLYNVNVGSADGIRYIWRKASGYTRVKEAAVKVSAPF